ncbi:dihydroorotate dehydrogenase electron transfer subunit [Virgibacillus xinjiangensis]|uniref:Dihydroorotate dehydrogenase B (NAD(+)), electron transfer subunit n=1 Tax=Virgibacillus xinjiangensis TaxID=393090 RepID=A0ABV7CVC8_9BACI
MINKEKMCIQSRQLIAADTIEMVLKNRRVSQAASPGQFLHISVPGHTLRRPISIADVDKDAGTTTILFKINGSGTERLAAYTEEMHLDILGPSGNGFPTATASMEDHTILLIGGGIGIPPLHYLGRTLAEQGKKVIAVLGFQSKSHVFYEKKFQQFAETFIVTDDGSYGNSGLVTDLLDDVTPFDRYYTCGPMPMLQAVTSKLAHKDGYLSLEERMGCGIGACFACVIPEAGTSGYRKICKDGPVFQAEEVVL